MRVTTVKKARKAQGNCGRCSDPINVGDSYRHWSFRYGGTQRRCVKPSCSPRQSELTQNDVLVMAYQIGEEHFDMTDNPEDFDDQVTEVADTIQEILDVIEEKMSNIEDGFGHTEIEAYYNLEEQQSEVESWMEEVSELDGGDFEADGDACTQCGLDETDGYHDARDAEEHADDIFHDFEAEVEFDSDGAIEALMEAIGACPV
ncbi:hypothetical protein LCGC14_0810030 [marine sediment metagenome]|uniref:Uncharacterized protein n=1 Tax=marine sediment metagenome TaxID=412755 RepID=A0A0F9Q755_9ZZZZ